MIRPLLKLPARTSIRFMRGRFAGLIVSAILSTLSVVLFFYPGLNYSIDFKGGTVIELRMAAPTHEDDVRAVFDKLPDGVVVISDHGLWCVRTGCSSSGVILRHTHHDVVG